MSRIQIEEKNGRADRKKIEINVFRLDMNSYESNTKDDDSASRERVSYWPPPLVRHTDGRTRFVVSRDPVTLTWRKRTARRPITRTRVITHICRCCSSARIFEFRLPVGFSSSFPVFLDVARPRQIGIRSRTNVFSSTTPTVRSSIFTVDMTGSAQQQQQQRPPGRST